MIVIEARHRRRGSGFGSLFSKVISSAIANKGLNAISKAASSSVGQKFTSAVVNGAASATKKLVKDALVNTLKRRKEGDKEEEKSVKKRKIDSIISGSGIVLD